MKIQKNNIARNLSALRQSLRYSQEEVAERVGVSRQTVAKWESGESIPDLLNCDALSRLYNVELSDLLHHDRKRQMWALGRRESISLAPYVWANAVRSFFPNRPGMFFK